MRVFAFTCTGVAVPPLVVTVMLPDALAEDIGVLRAVARHNRPPVPALDGARLPCLGVYATVEQGGVVQVGDRVR